MNATEAHASSSVYDVFAPLMERFGATCSPEEFYWAVNKAYHAAESKRYDTIHADMYEEEEMVWKDLLAILPSTPAKLSILDVGCGTGLVGHFTSTFHPDRVKTMCLLDPSREMLDVVHEKSRGWPFGVTLQHGDILSLPEGSVFDVVTINSVLHHVVDLRPFLSCVESLLRPGGVLLTAQDPRQGAGEDSTCRERTARVHSRDERRASLTRRLRRLMAPPIKRILRIERHDALIEDSNKRLLESGVITRGMDNKSTWAITDFHVPNQPGNFGYGLDVDEMASWMPSMQLLTTLTYHYHDVPWPHLTGEDREQERDWWQARDPHGIELALAWRKRSHEEPSAKGANR